MFDAYHCVAQCASRFFTVEPDFSFLLHQHHRLTAVRSTLFSWFSLDVFAGF